MRLTIIAACFVIGMCHFALAGETLYNGIVLPDQWPPRQADVPADPVTPAYLVSPPAVIPIDVGRQLFVDDFLIESTTLKREFHLAEYYPGNPVLRDGMPYSDGAWYDPADKLFKLWYMRGGTSYATSVDGIHWDRGPRDVRPGTNIVDPGARDSSTVWLDLDEKDPVKRYKMFRSASIEGRWRYAISFSADGIHWSDPPILTGDCGDRSTVFYNPFRKVWVFSIRHGWSEPRRRRYWEVRDLLRGPYWDTSTNPAPMWIGADSLDPPREDWKVKPQLYNLDAVAYESVMLGYFTIWHGQGGERPKPNNVCLGFSRDGWSWSRPDRRPFCPVSEDPRDWNWGNVQSAGGGCLVMGDTLYFYVSGRGGAGNATGMATLRRDGFASMEAGPEGGALTTRPVRFGGKYLFVNLDAPMGELRAEILDENDRVIAPFSLANCRAVTANKTLQQVTWRDADDLSALSGKTVKFRFELKSGKLYAFWVSPEASGASHGYVGACGPGYTESIDTVGIAAYRVVDPPPADGAAPTPAIWPLADSYTAPVSVTLSIPLVNESGATSIVYTTDGTTPTDVSPRYAGPFVVSQDATVKARAFADGLNPSETAVAAFRFVPTKFTPGRRDGAPVGRLWNAPKETTISLATDHKSVCKYDTRPGIPYAEMAQTFKNTGGTQHSTIVDGLAPDTSYTYYVKARDEYGNTNYDDYPITFFVTQDSYAPIKFEFEAEDGELTAPMAVHDNAEASGGKYVSSDRTGRGSVTFKMTAPVADDCIVWARTLSLTPNGADDSFYVSANGGAEDIFDTLEHVRGYTWHWSQVNGRDAATDPRPLALTKGENTITFRARESNTRLDRIIVTNDRSFTPQ